MFFRFLLYSLYTLTWIPITVEGILKRIIKNGIRQNMLEI